MRVLGLDPGSRRTGFGVVERRGNRSRCLAHGTVAPARAPRPAAPPARDRRARRRGDRARTRPTASRSRRRSTTRACARRWCSATCAARCWWPRCSAALDGRRVQPARDQAERRRHRRRGQGAGRLHGAPPARAARGTLHGRRRRRAGGGALPPAPRAAAPRRPRAALGAPRSGSRRCSRAEGRR